MLNTNHPLWLAALRGIGSLRCFALKELFSNYFFDFSEQCKLDPEISRKHTEMRCLGRAKAHCFTGDVEWMAHPLHKDSTQGNCIPGELLCPLSPGTEHLGYTGLLMALLHVPVPL